MTELTIAIDESLKDQAQKLFNELGMDTATAMTMFLQAAVRRRAMPFAVEATPDADEQERILQRRLTFFGCMKGKGWVADDFDAPLAEMGE